VQLKRKKKRESWVLITVNYLSDTLFQKEEKEWGYWGISHGMWEKKPTPVVRSSQRGQTASKWQVGRCP